MKALQTSVLTVVLGSIFATLLFAFTPVTAPPALATIKKTENGFKYLNANTDAVNKEISNGFKVIKVDFHYLDGTFFLVRKVVNTKTKKTGFLFSELVRKKSELFPKIGKVELFFACWQIASCQCERPSKYASCSCNGHGGTDGCSTELGPVLWESFFDRIYIWE